MKSKLQQSIEESYEDRMKKAKYLNFFEIDVFLNSPLPENIDLNYVFSFIGERVPSYILELIDVVYIGQFEDFEDRHINAKYVDGAIYITNEQDNNSDMVNDLVHELAHALEKSYGHDIYVDGLIKREFLGKRERLKSLLRYMKYDTHLHDFNNVSYDKEFDFFLYKDIGYDIIQSIITGLFMNPYSATSLGEYFAVGFESYYLNNGELLKKISPELYTTIDKLNDLRY